MSERTIDLNADVGESFGAWTLGDDAGVLAQVTSANAACGFHGGDPSTMRRTCELALEHDVRLGAHVSYRDLAGFGRRFLDCTESELVDDLVYQIGALSAMARAVGTRVSYVKPHGALYNALISHEAHARAVARAIGEVDPGLPLLTAPGSLAETAARKDGLRTVAEAFADRAYTRAGALVSRREAGAVLHDEQAVADRMRRLVTEGVIRAIDGTDIRCEAQSICVHGDTPGAVSMARAVRRGLEDAGVGVQAFT